MAKDSGQTGKNGEAKPLLKRVPDFTRGGFSFNYVKRGFYLLCRHALTLLLMPVAATVLLELGTMARTGQLSNMWDVARQTNLQFNMVTFMACCLLLTTVALTYVFTRVRPVYLLDYHCYLPPDRMKMSVPQFLDLSKNCGAFNERSLEFQEKIISRSGLGDETYLPDGA